MYGQKTHVYNKELKLHGLFMVLKSIRHNMDNYMHVMQLGDATLEHHLLVYISHNTTNAVLSPHHHTVQTYAIVLVILVSVSGGDYAFI